LIPTEELDDEAEAGEVDIDVGNWMLCSFTFTDGTDDDDDEEEEEEDDAVADDDSVVELLPLLAGFPPCEYHAHPFPATSLSLLATISYYNTMRL